MRSFGWQPTLLLLASWSIFACSTQLVPLSYDDRSITAWGQTPSIRVGPFTDDRGTDANWLGTIRAGYGIQLEKLRTNAPMREVVEEAFREALRARGVLAEPQEAVFEVRGSIRKFDCNDFFNREAHVHLDATLVRLPSNTALYSHSYRIDRSGRSSGIGLGSAGMLRQLAGDTLSEAIDQVLSDPDFRNALSSDVPAAGDAARRLLQLEDLRSRGLISEPEYDRKRQEILDSL